MQLSDNITVSSRPKSTGWSETSERRQDTVQTRQIILTSLLFLPPNTESFPQQTVQQTRDVRPVSMRCKRVAAKAAIIGIGGPTPWPWDCPDVPAFLVGTKHHADRRRPL